MSKLTKIPCIAKFLNLLSIEPHTIRDSEGVVVGDVVLIKPVGNFVFMGILDVSVKPILETVPEVWAATFFSTLLQVLLPSVSRGQALQNEETGKPKRPPKASFEDGWVDSGTVQLRPINLEVPVAVL